MKSYNIRVSVMAENMSDLIERLEDDTENPIDEFDEDSIVEAE